MDSTRKTRDYFLYGMAAIYMFAFGSWFIQIPGLYGDNGLLPVKNYLGNANARPVENLFQEKPTIVWLFLLYGLSPQTSVELLCVLGAVISFICLLFKSFRSMPMYIILWFLYLSLFQVGQTFSWFQWDTLLLESGFLTILVAPSSPTGSSLQRIPFFLVKWLLFRLMFASGIVKLSSGCQTWWGLTALNYHFETQCIPTPLAWWAHQLPDWFLKLGVVGTYVVEIALPFLFFAPVRRLRLIAMYGQILLMISIILTGNYNFFNFLTIVLCLSAIDDKHLAFYGIETGKKEKEFGTRNFRKLQHYLAILVSIIVVCGFSYYTILFFGLELFKKRDMVHSKITFSKDEYRGWVDDWTSNSIWIGAICFSWEAIYTFYLCLRKKNLFQSIWTIMKYVMILCICVYMFCISMVPYKSISSNRRCWPVVHSWHAATDKYELVHSYGLFRRMTGVGGRPEVILQGSNSETGPWKEIHFTSKPGNTSGELPWIIPHQPRLDWQMWFAALGQYHENAWFLSLVDKLMNDNKDVVKLLDKDDYPFKNVPPKFVKADLYLYQFTMITKKGGVPKRIWTRKFDKAYLPVVNKNHPDLKRFLEYHNLETKVIKKKTEPGAVQNLISTIRQYSEMVSPQVFLWSLWLTALVVTATRKMMTKALNK